MVLAVKAFAEQSQSVNTFSDCAAELFVAGDGLAPFHFATAFWLIP